MKEKIWYLWQKNMIEITIAYFLINKDIPNEIHLCHLPHINKNDSNNVSLMGNNSRK